tara:strand:+ start:1014 stop:1271 length:258 start_codon:yes stop_codon:yes gene_type:complete
VASEKTKSFVFPKKELYGEDSKFLGSHLDNAVEKEILLEDEPGTYIFPKPNRLVFLTSGVLHCITQRVTMSGQQYRGFLRILRVF